MSKKKKKRNPSKKYEFLRILKRSTFPLESLCLPDKLIPKFNDNIVFENGYRMSIQCGYHCYSSPRKNLKNLRDYDGFEVACFDMDGDSLVLTISEIEDGGTSDRTIEAIHTHSKREDINIMPYLSKEDVDVLYHYIKKQKRKFVIFEKTQKNKHEQQCEDNFITVNDSRVI